MFTQLLRVMVLLLMLPMLAFAQAWPTAKPIRFIVPFPAGGPTDVIGRQVAAELSKQLGQTIVVENIGGANGSIGMTKLAQSAPDGYTIGLGAIGTNVLNTFLYSKLAYDPVKDFTSLSLLLEYENVLIVNPKLPIHSIGEFIDYAKAHPGQLNYGSAGNGASNHLSGEMFASMADIKLTHIPYRGSGPALNDVMAGHLAFMFDTLATSLPQIQAGRVRAIATTGRARAKTLPDTPSLSEKIPSYDFTGWFALFAPSGLPVAIAERLNLETVKALNSPDLAAKFNKQGMRPVTSTQKQLDERINSDLGRWGAVVKASGARLD